MIDAVITNPTPIQEFIVPLNVIVPVALLFFAFLYTILCVGVQIAGASVVNRGANVNLDASGLLAKDVALIVLAGLAAYFL